MNKITKISTFMIWFGVGSLAACVIDDVCYLLKTVGQMRKDICTLAKASAFVLSCEKIRFEENEPKPSDIPETSGHYKMDE